jgi:hypothetical protein
MDNRWHRPASPLQRAGHFMSDCDAALFSAVREKLRQSDERVRKDMARLQHRGYDRATLAEASAILCDVPDKTGLHLWAGHGATDVEGR